MRLVWLLIPIIIFAVAGVSLEVYLQNQALEQSKKKTVLLETQVKLMESSQKNEDAVADYPEPKKEVLSTQDAVPAQKAVPDKVVVIPPAELAPAKVAVYLPHNGETHICDPEGADAIKDASSMIVKIQDEIAGCNNAMMQKATQCVNRCTQEKDAARTTCPLSNWSNCMLEALNRDRACLDGCKEKDYSCPSVNADRYSTLGNLLIKYCE